MSQVFVRMIILVTALLVKLNTGDITYNDITYKLFNLKMTTYNS